MDLLTELLEHRPRREEPLVEAFIARLTDLTVALSPTEKRLGESLYLNLFGAGCSLYFPSALDRLEAIEIYNSKVALSRQSSGPKYEAFPIPVVIEVGVGEESRTCRISEETTAQEMVNMLGEPSRKGGGGRGGEHVLAIVLRPRNAKMVAENAFSGISIWMEWSALGLYVDFAGRGLNWSLEQGGSAIWSVITMTAR